MNMALLWRCVLYWVSLAIYEWFTPISLSQLKNAGNMFAQSNALDGQLIQPNNKLDSNVTQIEKFMGQTWGPPGSCRPQMDPMMAPWTLRSRYALLNPFWREWVPPSLRAGNAKYVTLPWWHHVPWYQQYCPKTPKLDSGQVQYMFLLVMMV